MIDWDLVWKKFDEWFSKRGFPNWEEQQNKIQKLVQNDLKRVPNADVPKVTK